MPMKSASFDRRTGWASADEVLFEWPQSNRVTIKAVPASEMRSELGSSIEVYPRSPSELEELQMTSAVPWVPRPSRTTSGRRSPARSTALRVPVI